MRQVRTIADPKVREHYHAAMVQRLRELFAPAGQRGEEAARRRESRGNSRFAPRPAYPQDRLAARPAWVPPPSEAVRQSTVVRALTGSGPAAASFPRSEEMLILAALTHPFLLEEYAETFATLSIADASLDKLRRELLLTASSGQTLDSQGLRDHLRLRGAADICERLERRPMLKTKAMTRRDAAQDEVLREFNHVLARHRKLTELEAEHTQAAEALKREATEENLARLRAIDQELRSITGAEAGPPDSF
jgi:DNA primase